MLRTTCLAIAIGLLATLGLRAEEKSIAQKSAEWYLDAHGNPDSCKAGAPSPFMNMRAEDHAEIEKAIEACRERNAAAIQAAVERQQNEEARRAGERSAALRQAEAHRRYLSDHHLTAVSVVDLQANGKEMISGHVAVTGFVRILSEDMVGIYTSTGDVNGVRLDLSQASPQTRRRIFGFCSDINNPCQIEVAGTVEFDDHVLVQVE